MSYWIKVWYIRSKSHIAGILMILTTVYGFTFLGYMLFSKYVQRNMVPFADLPGNSRTIIYSSIVSLVVLFILASVESFALTLAATILVLGIGSIPSMRKNRVTSTSLYWQILLFGVALIFSKLVATVCMKLAYSINMALFTFMLSSIFFPQTLFLQYVAILLLPILNYMLLKDTLSHLSSNQPLFWLMWVVTTYLSVFSPVTLFLKSVALLLLAKANFNFSKRAWAYISRNSRLYQLVESWPVLLIAAFGSFWLAIDLSNPARLSRSMRAHLLGNYSQSTHRESVHRTVSESATKLKITVTSNRYTLSSVIDHYENSLSHRSDLSSEDRQSKLGQIQSARSILPKMDFSYQDRTSSVTISALTSLLANAIMDEQHRVAGVGAGTCQERLVDALSEMVEDEKMICAAGQFNKLIESQCYTLQTVSIESVSSTTISDYILLRLRALQARPPGEQLNPVEARQLLLENARTHWAEGTSLSSESVSRIKESIEQAVGGIELSDYFSFPNGR